MSCYFDRRSFVAPICFLLVLLLFLSLPPLATETEAGSSRSTTTSVAEAGTAAAVAAADKVSFSLVCGRPAGRPHRHISPSPLRLQSVTERRRAVHAAARAGMRRTAGARLLSMRRGGAAGRRSAARTEGRPIERSKHHSAQWRRVGRWVGEREGGRSSDGRAGGWAGGRAGGPTNPLGSFARRYKRSRNGLAGDDVCVLAPDRPTDRPTDR